MSKKHYFKQKSTSSIKNKSYFKKYTDYGIPTKESELEEWFKKEEERIRKHKNW